MVPCPGPDRHPRTPLFPLPPGSCDTHAHVFGPRDKFPFSADRSYTPEDCTAEEYIALLDTLGFDRGVVVQGGANGRDNRVTLDAIAHAPERLRGVAVILSGMAHSDLEALHHGGIRGVRMSSVVSGGAGFDQFERLTESVAPLGWHALLHFRNSGEFLEMGNRLRQSPVPFVLDHLARITEKDGLDGPAYGLLADLLEGGTCWVKLASLYRSSSEPYPHQDMLPIIHDVVRRRSDRIIWGSNWPHPIHSGKMPNDGDLVDLIPLWFPDEVDRVRALVRNPEVLYDFA